MNKCVDTLGQYDSCVYTIVGRLISAQIHQQHEDAAGSYYLRQIPFSALSPKRSFVAAARPFKDGPDGTRYQIKGRRVHRRNPSRQLSAIRDLAGMHFDILAGVIFDDDFRVIRATLIPRDIIEERSTYVAHTNSHRFTLREDVWSAPGVLDVTAKVAAAMP